MPEQDQAKRFNVLDSWRGICALLVAAYHFNWYWHLYDVSFIRGSWLFVDFFFVLSGFVVTHTYMLRLGGWADFRIFVIRRFGRLWPLHIATLLVLVLPEVVKFILLKFAGFSSDRPAFAGQWDIGALVASIFLVQSLGLYDELTWNTVSWSISTEFHTYIVFAAVVLFARTPGAILIWSVVVVLFSILVSVATYDPDDVGEAHFRFAMFRCLYGFFVGHLVYRLWARGAASLDRGWVIIEVLTCALIFLFVSLAWQSMWALVAPPIFGFVVLVFAQERGPISHILKTRAFVDVGMLSYSIYMVHPPLLYILGLIDDIVSKRMYLQTHIDVSIVGSHNPVSLYFWGNQWVMDGFAAFYLACVIALSALTYKFIEKPGRNFFNARA